MVRRITAALCAPLFLQLMLLGSGTRCAMNERALSAGVHAMQVTAAGRMRASVAAPSAAAVPEPPAGGSGSDCCQLPASGQSGACASAASCVPPAAPASTVDVAFGVPLVSSDLPEPPLIRVGLAAPPELPPPRA